MTNQSDKLDNEEHKWLMIKTTNRLHGENRLAITSSIKHSLDLIVWKHNKNKGYL